MLLQHNRAHLLVALLVLASAANGASATLTEPQHAVCSLVLQGYPDPNVLGVAAASLHCSSSSPVIVGINSTYLGTYASQFTGIKIASSLDCQQEARGSSIGHETRPPLRALLYFCGSYRLTLQQPSVQNVSLANSNPAWDSAIVAFGGNAVVNISQGHFKGNSAGSTLAALQEASVTLQDNTLIELNTAVHGAGVLALERASLVVRNSTLRSNHARWGGSMGCAHNASINIHSSSLYNNTAKEYGGAVAAACLGQVVIFNSTLAQNSAADGGGIYAGQGTRLSIFNSNLTANQAAKSGAALVLAAQSCAAVQSCTFSRNNATGGGGISCEGCKVRLDRTTFSNNTAVQYGGGLEAVKSAHVTCVSSTWQYNRAKAGGGVALTNAPDWDTTPSAESMPAYLSILGSSFAGNNATVGGGMFVKNQTYVNLADSSFVANNASYGGGMACYDCNMSVKGVVFTENSADVTGGGLLAVHEANISCVNSTWQNNTAGIGGGLAITGAKDWGANASVDDPPAHLSISTSTFTKNNATIAGGLHLQYPLQVSLANSLFTLNNATWGGGVTCYGCKLNVSSVNFTTNTAGNNCSCTGDGLNGYGGGLFAANQAQIKCVNSTWYNNTADAGGALAVTDSPEWDTNPAPAGLPATLLVSTSNFSKNNATTGGGVFLESPSQASITNSTFSSNNASWGGGVTCYGCKLNTSSVTFTENTADSSGGGVAASSPAQISCVYTSWHNNTADTGGGLAITAPDWDTNPSPNDQPVILLMSNNRFLGNNASTGGGMYLDKPSQTSLSHSTFSFNNASYGGGVTCFGCSLNASDVGFHFNNAVNNGGGLVGASQAQLQIIIDNSTWHYNTAASGGGLAVTGAPDWDVESPPTDPPAYLTITASSFSWNNASNSGGGVQLSPPIQVSLSSSNFTLNSATALGGGLSCDGCKLNVSDVKFLTNHADNYGGALNAGNQAQITCVNSTWHNNSADFGAGLAMTGALDWNVGCGCTLGHPGRLSISNSSFLWNNATSKGGGIYLEDQTEVVLQRNRWSLNSAMYGGAIAVSGQTTAADNNTAANTPTNSSRSSLHNHTSLPNATVSPGSGEQAPSIANILIASSDFAANSASNTGGAVWMELANFNITDCSITHSTAAQGGAIGCESSTCAVDATSVVGNTATARGGAVYCQDCVGALTDSRVDGNSAGAYGGAMSAGGSAQVVATRCTANQNIAPYGGAFSLEQASNLTVSHCSVQGNTANSSGGALFQTSTSTALITASSNVSNNTAVSGGATWSSGSSELTVADGSLIQGNQATDTGGGVYGEANAQVTINTSAVYNNQAHHSGGGIALEDSASASVTGSSITHNTAGGPGGGIYCANQAYAEFVDSLIANNTAASNGGGIRMEDTSELHLLGTTSVTNNSVIHGPGGGVSLMSAAFSVHEVLHAVTNNTALSDSNIESTLTSITVIGNTSVSGFVNRLGADEGLLHAAVNLSGYYGLPRQGMYAQAVLGSDQGTLLGMNRSDQHGIVYMSFKVVRPPGQYTVLFKCPDAWQLPAANMSLQIRSCARGEVTPTPESCQLCQQGYFSFEPHQGVCNTCPANSNCTGGDGIVPLPGHWRSSADSIQIHRCPNPSACQITDATALQACAADAACGMSDTYKDLQCASAYYGNLCGICSVGNGATKPFQCRQCMTTGQIIALYTLAAVVMLMLVKLLCYLTLRETGNASLPATSKPSAAELLRPLILYSQYMLIISSMAVDWPVSMAYPLKVLAWVWSPASSETLSIDCVLPHASKLPIAVQKVLFYLCIPVVLLLLLLLIEAISLQIKRARKHRVLVGLRDRMFASTLVAIFFFLPSVLRTLYSMFACITIDQPAEAPYTPAAVGSYWIYDMNQRCFEGYHRSWALGLGLPLVLLICVGLPTAVLSLLLLNKSRVSDQAFMRHYGFLFKSYKDRCSWWECVVLIQTMVLVAISVFGVNLGVFYQVIVMNAALIIILVMLQACKPYAYARVGKVFLHAICCLLLTSYTALTFLQYGTVEPSPMYGIVMGLVLVLVNLAFIISVLWQLARLVEWQQLKGRVHDLLGVSVHWRKQPARPEVCTANINEAADIEQQAAESKDTGVLREFVP